MFCRKETNTFSFIVERFEEVDHFQMPKRGIISSGTAVSEATGPTSSVRIVATSSPDLK